jgi:zinc-finger of a C2HC-type
VPSSPADVPVGKTMKNIESHNAIVSEAFNNNVMVRCPNCLRTFLEDRIEVHLRSCTSENPHKTSLKAKQDPMPDSVKVYSPEKATPAQKPHEKAFNRPKALMCHIW